MTHTDTTARTRVHDAVLRTPCIADGPALWRIASAADYVDTNAPYFYIMWSRDFAETSLVATFQDTVIGYITGYLRQDHPDTFVVWQQAIDADYSAPGLGLRMLTRSIDHAIERGARFFETTITSDNKAIIMVLEKFARQRQVEVTRETLFPQNLFPDDHPAEILYRIGPLNNQ